MTDMAVGKAGDQFELRYQPIEESWLNSAKRALGAVLQEALPLPLRSLEKWDGAVTEVVLVDRSTGKVARRWREKVELAPSAFELIAEDLETLTVHEFWDKWTVPPEEPTGAT